MKGVCSVLDCDLPVYSKGWCSKHYQRLRSVAVCSVEGCGESARSGRGMCAKHYQRWQKYGDPEETRLPLRGLGFDAYVEKTENCWLWTGGRSKQNGAGYGRFRIGEEKVQAHVYSYLRSCGEIPEGMFVLHHCDTPLCVRPDHLYLGTQKENMADMFARGRAASQSRTHCPHGHPYDEENTYVLPHGGRACRTCRSAAVRQYRDRVRERNVDRG